jgi:hypothetical protein
MIMSRPEIQLMAVSNVFTRLMHFVKKGDIEQGHQHIYDHGTLLSTGRVLVEMLDDNGIVTASKEFVAPSFIFIKKEQNHRLTALEDNTVCTCIHALRDVEDELIDPSFLVEPEYYGDVKVDDLAKKIKDKYNKQMKYFKTAKSV